MVLQRDAALKIWGWTSIGEKVKVTFNGKRASVITDKNGKWMMTRPPMKPGGPYQMKLEGKNSVTLKGILLGDVRLCSGQSNMKHQMKLHAISYANDIVLANFQNNLP
ncbi:hypothetical protein [Pedobacter alpinus]|uniref:Sialate O-acetylesterase n=1 Tax=Pedobacter alpinus TaxID=1590643 RepID=A0ABW5TWU8_9SPHI